MFFILSPGRSGSKTITSALDQFSNCTCLHEPKPELVVEISECFCGSYPPEEIAKVLRETRSSTVEGKIYGEANPLQSLLVPLLDEVFPDCQFIWLIRDGRDAVASMYFRGWYDLAVDPVQRPMWYRARLQGDQTGDFTPAEWTALEPFARCCWLWGKYNRVIESALANIPEYRWRQVRLDKLKMSLPDLARFLGLEGWQARVEKLNVAVQPVTYWESWTPEQKSLFERFCGSGMDRWFSEWRSADGVWRPVNYETPDRPSLFVAAKRRLARLKRLPRRIRLMIRDLARTVKR